MNSYDLNPFPSPKTCKCLTLYHNRPVDINDFGRFSDTVRRQQIAELRQEHEPVRVLHQTVQQHQLGTVGQSQTLVAAKHFVQIPLSRIQPSDGLAVVHQIPRGQHRSQCVPPKQRVQRETSDLGQSGVGEYQKGTDLSTH